MNKKIMAAAAAVVVGAAAIILGLRAAEKYNDKNAREKVEKDFLSHFTDTDDKERFFVAEDGTVFSKDAFLINVEGGVNQDYLEYQYRRTPAQGSTLDREENEEFYSSYDTGLSVNYDQYLTLTKLIKPRELENIWADTALELAKDGYENNGGAIKLDDERTLYLSSYAAPETELGGKIDFSLKTEGEIEKVVAFVSEQDAFSGMSRRYTETDGATLTLENGELRLKCKADNKNSIYQYGIICITRTKGGQ